MNKAIHDIYYKTPGGALIVLVGSKNDLRYGCPNNYVKNLTYLKNYAKSFGYPLILTSSENDYAEKINCSNDSVMFSGSVFNVIKKCIVECSSLSTTFTKLTINI